MSEDQGKPGEPGHRSIGRATVKKKRSIKKKRRRAHRIVLCQKRGALFHFGFLYDEEDCRINHVPDEKSNTPSLRGESFARP